jgi:hypothetical protein
VLEQKLKHPIIVAQQPAVGITPFVPSWCCSTNSFSRRLLSRYWQPYGHYRGFTEFTLHFDFATVQIEAALYDHQTETLPRALIDVMAAMESAEEPFSIGFWNSDALVADSAHDFCSSTLDLKALSPLSATQTVAGSHQSMVTSAPFRLRISDARLSTV